MVKKSELCSSYLHGKCIVSRGVQELRVIRTYLATAKTVMDVSDRPYGHHAPFLSDKERQDFVELCSFGWKVRYQRRRVETEEVSMDFEVDLPESQIRQMLQQCIASKNPHRFPFPVAFSSNLDRLVVLRSVLTIRYIPSPESEDVVPLCRFQALEHKAGTRSACGASELSAFYSCFSPDSKALAFVWGRIDSQTFDSRRVQVWSDVAAEGDWPNYQYRGEVLTSRMSWNEEVPGDCFKFHPYLPILIFTEWNTTAAWNFDTQGEQTSSYYVQPQTANA